MSRGSVTILAIIVAVASGLFGWNLREETAEPEPIPIPIEFHYSPLGYSVSCDVLPVVIWQDSTQRLVATVRDTQIVGSQGQVIIRGYAEERQTSVNSFGQKCWEFQRLLTEDSLPHLVGVGDRRWGYNSRASILPLENVARAQAVLNAIAHCEMTRL